MPAPMLPRKNERRRFDLVRQAPAEKTLIIDRSNFYGRRPENFGQRTQFR
jgi:hypothetical protein